VLGVGFLAVAVQLTYLQILSGERLAALSDKNRIRLRPIVAPRGILFDRTGLPLVDNRPAFTLVVVPRDVPDLGALVDRLAGLVQTPASELRERLGRVSSDSPWPLRLLRGLTLEEVARIEEWRLDLPGVTVEVEPQRAYPGVRFAAHLPATSARPRTRISVGAASAAGTSSARPGSSGSTTSTSAAGMGASRSRWTPTGG
jgi:penicillin-binding protein 2